MGDLNQLFGIDERSRAFEEHKAGLLACMAGPGTGKTTSLIMRIKALAAQQVQVDTICYLTFIRAIADAFQRDYEKECAGGDHGERPSISTLHSFTCRLLCNYAHRVNYDGALYFINIADREDVGARVFRKDLVALARTADTHTAERARSKLNHIKAAWQTLADPADLAEPLPRVHTHTLELLQAFRVMDWDQTVPLALDLLETMDEAPKWIAKLDHYLVDEYQDFNPAQQAFVTLLAKGSKSIVVVGDDDQSIYSSRGGSPEGIRGLFNPAACDCVSLVRCHRCKSAIVESANAFLNAMRDDCRPMAAKHVGGKIACYSFRSAKAEIAYLRKVLSKAIAAIPDTPNEKDGVVCLFPGRKTLDFYFDHLKDDVTCVRRAHATDGRRQWLEWTLDLARRSGQRFLQRLLLDHYKAVKPALKQALIRVMIERDISTSDAMKVLLEAGEVPKASRVHAEAFCAFCDSLENRDPSAVAAVVGAELGKDPEEVLGTISQVLKALDEEADIDDAIRHACDDLLPESKEAIPDPRSVLFLTIHGSKGLTRRIVVLPGMEQAMLPADSEGEELEEKKRLFYVALTRATDGVLITYPRTRGPRGDPFAYARSGNGEPSSFLASAGIQSRNHD